MSRPRTVALVGAVGGAGATRLSVELGATLARAGRDAAVFDAAFATQGLAGHVDADVDGDATALLTDSDRPLADACYDLPGAAAAPGRLALVPAFAPFARVAAAKAPDAARTLGDRLAEALASFDHALVDVPPVASNQAVAAVTAADRRALVVPDSDRGVDALQRARGRLADVGVDPDLVVANRVAGDAPPDADRAVPSADAACPAALASPDGAFAEASAALAEDLFETDLGLSFDGGALAAVTRRLP